jgi:hypothetical protein
MLILSLLACPPLTYPPTVCTRSSHNNFLQHSFCSNNCFNNFSPS